MARPVSNPPNPWETTHVEWLGPPPSARLEVFEERAKSALSRNDSPDVPFRWGVNPYRGCQHACAYCYARRTHPYLGLGAGTDFEKKIVVKTNLPEVLERELWAEAGICSTAHWLNWKFGIGLTAAREAGIPTLITISEYSRSQCFDGAVATLETLSELGGLDECRRIWMDNQPSETRGM